MHAVVRTFSIRNDTNFVTATPEIKIRDLKIIKQDNVLKFLILLDQKLKVIPNFATVEKKVTVISSTLFDCEDLHQKKHQLWRRKPFIGPLKI